MNYISILGLVALLAIAWGLSYHKSDIKLKPIVWGIGLQLLFAMIILREDMWSFVGMGILGLLLITYLLQKDDVSLGNNIISMFIIIIASSALVAAVSISFMIFICGFQMSYFMWNQ